MSSQIVSQGREQDVAAHHAGGDQSQRGPERNERVVDPAADPQRDGPEKHDQGDPPG
jgi:hypothetical protein